MDGGTCVNPWAFLPLILVSLALVAYFVGSFRRAKRLADLWDNGPDPCASVDINGVLLVCNQTFLKWTGYQKHELIGEKIHKVYDSSCHSHVDQVLAEFRENHHIIGAELLMRTKEGVIVPVSLNINAVMNGKIVIATRSTWRDMSEILELRQRVHTDISHQIYEKAREHIRKRIGGLLP